MSVRPARSFLVGASDLARSMTYTFATFEMRRSGASAGINAVDDDRADAMAKFTAEVAPMVASGRFLPEPGTRVPRTALESLAEADPRAGVGDVADQALVAGVVAAAAQASGGLDGRTVAIEGSGPMCDALTNTVQNRGRHDCGNERPSRRAVRRLQDGGHQSHHGRTTPSGYSGPLQPRSR